MKPLLRPYVYPDKHDKLLREPSRKRRGVKPLTVCIAAITENMVLLAADRMLTAGDIQFEPPVEKIIYVTTSIVVLFSGDSAFHIEIMRDVHTEVQRRVTAAPDEWLSVKQVADLYIKYRNDAKRQRSEAAVLAPLGLTHETWLDKQRTMHSDLVKNIASDLINFDLPDVDVIVAGIDLDDKKLGHAHIWTIYNGVPACQDSVGFASVGSGSRHAESQFMLARHSYRHLFAETLLLIYSAKRDSEVAPGVGKATDLFAVGPYVGQWMQFSDEVKAKLEMEYRSLKREQEKIREQASAEVTRYVKEIAPELLSMTSSNLRIDKRRRSYVRLVGEIQHALNQALVEEHEKRGLTKSQIAEILGTHKSFVTRKLSGVSNMTLETLADLAFALDRPVKVELPSRWQPTRSNHFSPMTNATRPIVPKGDNKINVIADVTTA